MTENIGEWADRIRANMDEEDRIVEALRCSPLCNGDKMQRANVFVPCIGLLSFSVAIRNNGSVEFWVQRCNEPAFSSLDPNVQKLMFFENPSFTEQDDTGLDSTHKGWTLVKRLTTCEIEKESHDGE